MTKIRVRDVVGATSILTGVPRKEIMGTARHRKTVRARQVAMIMARRLTDRSFLDVGHQFGKDHSTVIHAIRTYGDKITPEQERAIADVSKRLADRFWGSFRAE
jgi:chromosomal replication initiator protein